VLRNRDLHFNLKIGATQQSIAMKSVKAPSYSVGDVVRNALTGEEGQIVRTLNSSELRKVEPPQTVEPAYIVSLSPGPFARAREALWLRSEVVPGMPAEGREQTAPDDAPDVCWVCGRNVFPEQSHGVDSVGRPVHIECHRSDSIPIDVGSA